MAKFPDKGFLGRLHYKECLAKANMQSFANFRVRSWWKATSSWIWLYVNQSCQKFVRTPMPECVLSKCSIGVRTNREHSSVGMGVNKNWCTPSAWETPICKAVFILESIAQGKVQRSFAAMTLPRRRVSISKCNVDMSECRVSKGAPTLTYPPMISFHNYWAHARHSAGIHVILYPCGCWSMF
jgi:hypothetical protein